MQAFGELYIFSGISFIKVDIKTTKSLIYFIT